MQYWGCYIDQV